MTSMKVESALLRQILIKNRDNHRGSFLKAQEVYKVLVVEELDKMLTDARNGSNIRRHVNLSQPEDHIADYNKLIGLLELSSSSEVDLTLAEYDQYVNDQWHWSRKTNNLHNNYAARNISPMFVGEDVTLPSSY